MRTRRRRARKRRAGCPQCPAGAREAGARKRIPVRSAMKRERKPCWRGLRQVIPRGKQEAYSLLKTRFSCIGSPSLDRQEHLIAALKALGQPKAVFSTWSAAGVRRISGAARGFALRQAQSRLALESQGGCLHRSLGVDWSGTQKIRWNYRRIRRSSAKRIGGGGLGGTEVRGQEDIEGPRPARSGRAFSEETRRTREAEFRPH